jgi:hypothetical protein
VFCYIYEQLTNKLIYGFIDDSLLNYLFIGLAFMFKRAWVLKRDPGDGKMKRFQITFMKALAFRHEYRLLAFLCSRTVSFWPDFIYSSYHTYF